MDRVAWDQQGRNVDYYVFLDGVGNVSKDDLSVRITETSIEIKVKNLNGRRYRHNVRRLHDTIRPEDSFWKVKKDCIVFKLCKDKEKKWSKLDFDPQESNQQQDLMHRMKGDPENAMIEMMRGMYQGGDDDMKRTMAKAWHEAQEKNARGDNRPWDKPFPSLG